jgi:hypothetical protein
VLWWDEARTHFVLFAFAGGGVDVGAAIVSAVEVLSE